LNLGREASGHLLCRNPLQGRVLEVNAARLLQWVGLNQPRTSPLQPKQQLSPTSFHRGRTGSGRLAQNLNHSGLHTRVLRVCGPHPHQGDSYHKPAISSEPSRLTPEVRSPGIGASYFSPTRGKAPAPWIPLLPLRQLGQWSVDLLWPREQDFFPPA
jgi:hypothetical protein